MTATKRGVPKVALVIGSGSVKCAAALGLWKVLQRNGIRLDMVVGSSGGSVYATGIAFGDDIATIEDRTRTLWVDLMSGYSSSLRAAIAGETHFNERSGLVDADGFHQVPEPLPVFGNLDGVDIHPDYLNALLLPVPLFL